MLTPVNEPYAPCHVRDSWRNEPPDVYQRTKPFFALRAPIRPTTASLPEGATSVPWATRPNCPKLEGRPPHVSQDPPNHPWDMRPDEAIDVIPDVAFERPADREAELRVRRGAVRFLTIPEHRFVMADGSGPPDPEAFEARAPGLYTVAFGLRFALKRRGVLGKVGPLEGLWWRLDGATDPDQVFASERAEWRWTLMIVLPDEATRGETVDHLAAGRQKLDPEIAETLRVDGFEEGAAAQLLHIGPYAEERPSVERLHEAIRAAGHRPCGKHHEIYLSDPRRTAPERLRTILRQPVMSM